METLLWLDDIRNPFKDDWLNDYAPRFKDKKDSVTWVKSYNEFMDWILRNGLPTMIAFDHDLGENVAKERVSNGMSKRKARKLKRETMSGHDCAKWLVEYCVKNEKTLPLWVVQSANPVGRDNINGLLNGFRKHQNK